MGCGSTTSAVALAHSGVGEGVGRLRRCQGNSQSCVPKAPANLCSPGTFRRTESAGFGVRGKGLQQSQAQSGLSGVSSHILSQLITSCKPVLPLGLLALDKTRSYSTLTATSQGCVLRRHQARFPAGCQEHVCTLPQSPWEHCWPHTSQGKGVRMKSLFKQTNKKPPIPRRRSYLLGLSAWTPFSQVTMTL